MRFEFRLPDVGEGITEASVMAWHAQPGDSVSEDQALLDIETDKATVEIPAPCSGQLLEQRVAAGIVAHVGDVVAVFETERPPRQQFAGDRKASPAGAHPPADSRPVPEADTAPAAIQASGGNVDPAEGLTVGRDTAPPPHATPSTRAYARTKGVELQMVRPTGPGGRILKRDVDVHVATTQAAPLTTRELVPGADPGAAHRETAERRIALTGVRRAMFDAMTRAARVPQATTGFSARAACLEGLRDRLIHKTGVKISYLALVMKAVLPALRRHPTFNASLEDGGFVIESYRYHLGFAVHTEAGLMVPVIRDAAGLDLLALNERIARLTALARERRLSPEEARGATFTVTNWGSHATHETFGTPLVNPPEVAILGMARIRDEAVVANGAVAIERRMPMALSYDHRLIDGVAAVTFMSDVLAAIEDADVLLSRL